MCVIFLQAISSEQKYFSEYCIIFYTALVNVLFVKEI